jgi:hypothetical protein
LKYQVGCAQPTWYFNYAGFQPQGVAVRFDRGRADAFFTVWSPTGWRTSAGVRIGDSEPDATYAYPGVLRFNCGTYTALVARTRRGDLQVYVRDGKVWGLGISRAGAPPCH